MYIYCVSLCAVSACLQTEFSGRRRNRRRRLRRPPTPPANRQGPSRCHRCCAAADLGAFVHPCRPGTYYLICKMAFLFLCSASTPVLRAYTPAYINVRRSDGIGANIQQGVRASLVPFAPTVRQHHPTYIHTTSYACTPHREHFAFRARTHSAAAVEQRNLQIKFNLRESSRVFSMRTQFHSVSLCVCACERLNCCINKVVVFALRIRCGNDVGSGSGWCERK